ncbi:MAG: hypothetical protein A3H30_05285 [Alphaproteobacteria bacterium RIFCSPLOWO2_02_FULL_40_19]|nr:MAG: hypothetical protein A2794_04165 [Alphaproteobacteria bacterium RIFCSPHIGHO2_01_FULL_40_8]OFX10234.1 MAG: hypothetical protein A3H30_05285 [Alphaproteobacteria bacterium RIFCSPLOWO2_02_FULL_40_19]
MIVILYLVILESVDCYRLIVYENNNLNLKFKQQNIHKNIQLYPFQNCKKFRACPESFLTPDFRAQALRTCPKSFLTPYFTLFLLIF